MRKLDGEGDLESNINIDDPVSSYKELGYAKPSSRLDVEICHS